LGHTSSRLACSESRSVASWRRGRFRPGRTAGPVTSEETR
jgi:hypothetical protein